MHHGKFSCTLEFIIWRSYQCDQDKEIIFQKQVYTGLSFLYNPFFLRLVISINNFFKGGP